MRIDRIVRALDRHAVLAVVLGAAVFWAAALGVIAFVRYSGDLRAFLCLGDLVAHPAALADAPRTGTYGYDGQYYAALATDPLLLHAETARSLDAPAYRATRILIPAAAYVLALGNGPLAVLLYQWLCWGLAIAAVGIVAAWLLAEGRRPWPAFLLAISAGLVVSIIRTTPDAAALALLLAALFLQRRNRAGWAVVALAAAVLARETSLLALPALAVAELRRRKPAVALAFAGVPAAAFVGWQSRLWFLAGVPAEGAGNFSLPFVWLPAKVVSLVGANRDINWMEVFGLLSVVAAMACLAALLARPQEIGPVEGTFVAFALLGVFLNEKIYVEAYSYGRVLIALPFLALIAAARQPGRGRRWLLQAVAVLFALVGLVALRGELRSEHIRAAWNRLAPRSTPAAVAPLPSPAALPAPTVTPTPAPPPPPALILLPAARIDGHDGARWRTELVLENPSTLPVRLKIELLLAGKDNTMPRTKELSLEGGGRFVSEDALGELFAADGAGALRVRSDRLPVKARLRTYEAARKSPRGHFLEGSPETAGFGPGHAAVLRGLANDPDANARKRTNLGMLNVGSIPIDVEIGLRDEAGIVLGKKALRLRAWEFRQVNDVFAALGAGKAPGGSATVTTATPGGSLLAYAAVVRRQPPGVTYVTVSQSP